MTISRLLQEWIRERGVSKLSITTGSMWSSTGGDGAGFDSYAEASGDGWNARVRDVDERRAFDRLAAMIDAQRSEGDGNG